MSSFAEQYQKLGIDAFSTNRTGSFAEQAAMLNKSHPAGLNGSFSELAAQQGPDGADRADRVDAAPCLWVVTGPASGPPREAVVSAVKARFQSALAAFSVRQVMDAWTADAVRLGSERFKASIAPLALHSSALERWFPKQGSPTMPLRDLGRAAAPLFQAFASIATDDALDALGSGKFRHALVNGVLDSASRADVIMAFQDRAYPDMVVPTAEKALKVSASSAFVLGKCNDAVQAAGDALYECAKTGNRSSLTDALRYATCAAQVAEKAKEMAGIARQAFDAGWTGADNDASLNEFVDRANEVSDAAVNSCVAVQKKRQPQQQQHWRGYGGYGYDGRRCDRHGNQRLYGEYQCPAADRFVMQNSTTFKLINYVSETILDYADEEARTIKAQAFRAASRPAARGRRRENGAALVAIEDSCVVLSALTMILKDCVAALVACADAERKGSADVRDQQYDYIVRYVKHAELCRNGKCPSAAQSAGAMSAPPITAACLRIVECLPDADKGDYKRLNDDDVALAMIADDRCFHTVLQGTGENAAIAQQNVADPVVDAVMAKYVADAPQIQYVACSRVFERVARYLQDVNTAASVSRASYSAE